MLRGMVFKRQVQSDVKKVHDARIVVFSCPLDLMQTETKVWGDIWDCGAGCVSTFCVYCRALC